jgi:hypothetical protein
MKTPKRPRKTTDPSPGGKPIPILLPELLLQHLDDVAEKMDMSRANVMRLCMKIGLEQLHRVNYDLAGLVVTANTP